MAKHDVYATLPNALMGKEDAFFHIYQDSEKLGSITISKGAIEWYSRNAKKPYKFTWSQFDKMIKKEYGEK
jgi:hypothetical protein